MKLIKNYIAGNLEVNIYDSRSVMGKMAANYVAEKIREIAAEKNRVRIVFAAAVSQKEFFFELLKIEKIPWNKIVAFQMDEYHILSEDAPQRFGNFLYKHLYRHKNFRDVHYMDKNINEYAKKIQEDTIDISCLGIGENGHLAFNDPPVADFNDPEIIKEIRLEKICRLQQVNDGAFDHIEEVPEKAVTITIPILMKAEMLSVVVPGVTKANAVTKTLFDPISTDCPSTILRAHANAKLFLDSNSAKNILSKI